MNFRVELEVFRGPLDLLLYLVRKHEVEITEIPIAPITEQFLAYLRCSRSSTSMTWGSSWRWPAHWSRSSRGCCCRGPRK